MNMNPHQTICKPEHQQDGAAKATKFWLLVILLALSNSTFLLKYQSVFGEKKYIRVFVKTTLGIAFHHLGPTFINAYIVKLLQTWITLDKPFQFIWTWWRYNIWNPVSA